MNIYMLDHDPKLAAQYHSDHELVLAAVTAAKYLSQAWHDLYSDWSRPPMEDHKPLGAVTRVVPYASHPRPPAGVEPKMLQADGKVPPGGEPVWLLLGQRIYPPAITDLPHPCALWVQELGGNYDWTWRLAMELVAEARTRGFVTPTKDLARALHTLETLPPPLLGTKGDWSEAPVLGPNIYRVEQDGFYDTVASHRLRYASEPDRVWSVRNPPWLHEAKARIEELTTPTEA